MSFSLWKNSKALFSLERSSGDISTIHGIRFINAALLLLSHKSMAIFFNPHMNRTRMIEVNDILIFNRHNLFLFQFTIFFDFATGYRWLCISDWSCSSSLYRCIYYVERFINIIHNNWPIESESITTHSTRIFQSILTYCSNAWCIDFILHICITWIRSWSTMEFSCE